MVVPLDYTMLYIVAGSYMFSFIAVVTMLIFIGRSERARKIT
jgi:hypothetical protein